MWGLHQANIKLIWWLEVVLVGIPLAESTDVNVLHITKSVSVSLFAA